MPNLSIHQQRGQAMSEFLVAMAAFVPLMLGTVYIAKYSDMKHQAIQASRYAAFERALDPSIKHENAAVLEEETRTRFFTNGSTNDGKIGYQDSTGALNTADTENAVWDQLNGKPMIAGYQDISVKFPAYQSLNSGIDAVAQAEFSLTGGGQVQANVEVKAAAITHFAPLNRILSIGASTVVAGDAWNAAGKDDVSDHFNVFSVPTVPLRKVTDPLIPLFEFFSSSKGPQWGCVDADAVPQDHLSKYKAPGDCSN